MEKIALTQDLLHWYHAAQRQLPWRMNHDPYRIWISEVMLQQTQVATVIDYFNRFITAFPTVFDLAKATEDEVFKYWEGLGYYSRARNLMRCAQLIATDYDGQFPMELSPMLKLPGIGPYTAGAILSIAFNLKVPAVDGNVMRVISRLYGLTEDISLPQTRVNIEKVVSSILPEDCRHFNQALMELGATVCTPKLTKCDICPVQAHCTAYSEDLVTTLPIKLGKIKKTTHVVPVAYIESQGEVLFIKRNAEGLLGGLWALPAVEGLANETLTDQEQVARLKEWAVEHFDISLSEEAILLGQSKHVFTHKTWLMNLWHFKTTHKPHVDLPQNVWISRTEFNTLALPTAFVKLIKKSKSPQ